MSADRHRAIRREKQKRAKDIKREVKKQFKPLVPQPLQPLRSHPRPNKPERFSRQQ